MYNMYSNFSCGDLTGASRGETMSSADSTTTTTASLESLKTQLVSATTELQTQQSNYNSAKAIWDSCSWRGGAWALARGGKGYFIGNTRKDGYCRQAQTDMNAASGKIADLNKTIKTLNEQIDKFGSTDPQVLAAQANANAVTTQSQASASRTKIIAWSIAGVVVLLGITYAVMKLRKK